MKWRAHGQLKSTLSFRISGVQNINYLGTVMLSGQLSPPEKKKEERRERDEGKIDEK
jgi:hypothetical protein